MNNIESIYLNYDRLLSEFSETAIKNRYSFLYKECCQFIECMDLQDKVQINETTLMHMVLDYFSDVSRLKSFHKIYHINETKVISYESYWLLRRKPLQVIKEDSKTEFLTFVNEKFIFSRISSFLLKSHNTINLNDSSKKSLLNYLDTLYYYLKYRHCEPQIIELAILSFQAGELFS